MENILQEKVNIMIIGVGNHARRIYVPKLKNYEEFKNFKLKAGVEIHESKKSVDSYLKEKGYDIKMTYISKFSPTINTLPQETVEILNKIVKENNIRGVVISTEPLVHKVYAQWALRSGLNILMDKPISTRMHVTSNIDEAMGLTKDYEELLSLYETLQQREDTIFSINVQRRFEPGFMKVFELIKETKERFNIPVTSIQAQHADGVWIFPHEIVEQVCHPYFQGYGKCSHSGYHIFDIIWKFFESGIVEDKKPDTGETFSAFVQPQGVLTQFNQNDYTKIFGKGYEEIKKWEDKELFDMYKDYGENDAFSILRLLKEGTNVCNISINLLHNSFSRRAWAEPSEDLYKGNGRVKSQSYYIQQGPFQCIQIHNYQSNDNHDHNTKDDYLVGGNNHFDIYVFRNAAMYEEGTLPLEVIHVKDLDRENKFDDSKLYYETVKEEVILEFIDFISGKINKADLKSNIDSHKVPVCIMSSVYQSHINQIQGTGNLARFNID